MEKDDLLYRRELICIGNSYKEVNMHKWGPGCRNIYSLHYILSGRGYVRTGGQTFVLDSGQSFLIFPGEEYYYYPDKNNPWEYIWVDFYGKEADRLIGLTAFTKSCPVMEKKENMESFFAVSVHAKDRITKEEQETANLHLLLTKYFRENLSGEAGNVKEYIQLAKEYIGNYFWRSDLTVPEIAAQLHIDRTYLYRLFKEKIGLSPSQYIENLRIERACVLLERTDMLIQSVAGSVGYEDALYFSKIFKKIKGISPKDYRKRTQLPLSR